MRLFLAIELPAPIKKKLEKELTEIRNLYPYFNWVSWENFHITLHFYGERKDEEKIKKKLKDVLFDQESFYLYSNTVDIFINKKIIIYLGFKREKKIEQLVDKVRKTLPENADIEKKFVPHLTLARWRIPSKQQYFVIKKKLTKLKINISFLVKKIVLFESVLGGKKPIYKKRDEINLL